MEQFPETKEALLWLHSGVEDFWIAIDGGGCEGEFDKDYSLEGCLNHQDLICNLQDNGCKVRVWYHRAFNTKTQKDSYTKVLVVTLGIVK